MTKHQKAWIAIGDKIDSLERDKADLIAALRECHDHLLGLGLSFHINMKNQPERVERFISAVNLNIEKMDRTCETVTTILARLAKGGV